MSKIYTPQQAMLFTGLLIVLFVTLSFASFARAQFNPINQALDRVLENFIVLDIDAVLSHEQRVDTETDPLLLFENSIRLQAPDVTAEKYAKYLSEAGGWSVSLWESDYIDASVAFGGRGTFDVTGGFFKDGLEANLGAFGLTPTLNGQLWLGTQELGILLESEYGAFGQNNGWLGAVSASWNPLNEVPKPYSRSFSGFGELLLGATASFMDQTFANSHAFDNPNVNSFALQSISAGMEAIYDFGGGIRASLPLTWEFRPHSAINPFGSNVTQDFRVGLSLGYRYE